MFGHHDDDKDNQPQPDATAADEHTAAVVSQDGDQPQPAAMPPDDHPEPATPVDDITPPPGYQPPAPSDSVPADSDAPIGGTVMSDGDADAPASDDLLGVRQQALSDLSPLIDHLEHQTPEEKFQVTMMMIQANDDRSLIPTAYETAKLIGDDKARAQALLDIVQEINYFTHPKA